jgi:hypothetical protein
MDTNQTEETYINPIIHEGTATIYTNKEPYREDQDDSQNISNENKIMSPTPKTNNRNEEDSLFI